MPSIKKASKKTEEKKAAAKAAAKADAKADAKAAAKVTAKAARDAKPKNSVGTKARIAQHKVSAKADKKNIQEKLVGQMLALNANQATQIQGVVVQLLSKGVKASQLKRLKKPTIKKIKTKTG